MKNENFEKVLNHIEEQAVSGKADINQLKINAESGIPPITSSSNEVLQYVMITWLNSKEGLIFLNKTLSEQIFNWLSKNSADILHSILGEDFKNTLATLLLNKIEPEKFNKLMLNVIKEHIPNEKIIILFKEVIDSILQQKLFDK